MAVGFDPIGFNPVGFPGQGAATGGSSGTAPLLLFVLQQGDGQMLIDVIKKGATDRSVTIRALDSTTGLPSTGLVHNSSGMDLWYRREGGAKVSITEASLSALTDAHADGGFLHVGDGVYRLDLPDAAFATGANYVDIGGTVTGAVLIGGRVRLVNVDHEDAAAFGLSRVDAAISTRGSQTSVDDVPTNAELATALAAADDAVLAAIAALNNLSAAQVNAEVVDALATDTYAEITGVPGFNVPISTMIRRLYAALINPVSVTATKKQFKNAAGTNQWEKDLSDDGTTYLESAGNAP